MYILGIIFIGLLVGILAKLLTPGNDPGGLVMTILLGIAGSFVAHHVGNAVGWYSQGEPAGFFASVLGAMALLLVGRLLFRRRRS